MSDRAINLFFGGGLYGGFISFFSVLSILEAVQFPMAAHPDFKCVAETIVKNKINVILGMPSYILQLFENSADILQTYRGVEKIFYGGEHFSASQRRYLTGRFGVSKIRSGAYGSVDLGPLGFQCGFCEEGVHHLHQQLQYLEILKLGVDKPIEDEEIGRLVFTPRDPTSNKPPRYEIGDLGHWIVGPGPCPCGRQAPRFKLLGRTGDIFRVGTVFLNYQKFLQILSSEGKYEFEAQILIDTVELRDRVCLKISDQGSLTANECMKICLELYDDLREAVSQERTLLFEVRSIPSEAFERTVGSGKLIRVVDRRILP